MNGKPTDSANWDSYWKQKARKLDEWDYLSQVILLALREEIGDVSGKHIAEAGSGTGRISMRLAQDGARVTLVDYGSVALGLSRVAFARNGHEGFHVQADIHDMPFRAHSFDIVWNAGVMEHYLYERQTESIESLVRLCKAGGIFITLNPYEGSFVYRFGKFVLERTRKWPFGNEYPVKSLRGVSRNSRVRVIKEYPIGFVVILVEAYKFLPKWSSVSKLFHGLSKLFVRFAKRLVPVDRFLSRMLGGYLLVSVIESE